MKPPAARLNQIVPRFAEIAPRLASGTLEGEAFVAALPIHRFYGVGPVTAQRMRDLGIETGEDLKTQTEAFLTQHFGKSGPY